MSSLAELPELVGFFSYSREDDEAFKGTLSALRDSIQRELSAQLGRSKRTFRLWQDQTAIAPGKLWESEIKTAIDGSFFFIPIVTPRSVRSKYCKFEFDAFLDREKAIGRSDLVFPILYITVAALENEAKWRDDPVLSTVGRRQYVDWRSLRHLDVHTTAVREQIERLCQKIVEALNEPWVPPEERQRMEEAKARQQAEEKARRLLADGKRRAEAEQHRKQAEPRRRADEEERRKRTEAVARPGAEDEAEAKPRTFRERIPTAFVKNWQNKHSARVVAGMAVLAVLLLIGGGYAFLRHTVEKGTQQVETEANRKVAEAERRAKAAAETGAFTIRRGMEASWVPGSPRETLYSQSFKECEQKCAQSTTCSVFTWSIGPGVCYLYPRANLAPNADFDSGIRPEAEADAKRKADLWDADIAIQSNAIRLNPNDAAAFHWRGIYYSNKFDYDRAIADFSEAIRLRPNAVDFSLRGNSYFDKKNYSLAIDDYSEAIRLDPNRAAAAYCNRGKAKRSINDPSASADIVKASELDRNINCR